MAPKRPRPSEQSSKQVCTIALWQCSLANFTPLQPHGKRRKGGEDAPAEADPAAQVASVKAYMVRSLIILHLALELMLYMTQFHATKLLLKALKKSRTFETQKLTRKVKQTK